MPKWWVLECHRTPITSHISPSMARSAQCERHYLMLGLGPSKSVTSTPMVRERSSMPPWKRCAIRELFGAHADRLAVSSTKSLHGHARGATGAMEALCTVLALENGILPPTGNLTVPDPDCNLDVVPNRARTAQAQFALSNSFAFGGLNAVLAFRGPDN
jgi:3-oxoacyl-(acyl-carrier-protein) synthase